MLVHGIKTDRINSFDSLYMVKTIVFLIVLLYYHFVALHLQPKLWKQNIAFLEGKCINQRF